ncbi:MAG: molecular chaperone [Nitrosomonadales bacterium]|nr:molecular chaperone [Nitrosomonadales bacterium]
MFNSGDKPANIQVRAMDWQQDAQSGAEQLTETDELVFFPKIFSVPPKGQQVVRVGYQKEVGNKEKSFRLFVRELPVDEPGVTGARFALQISSPAFIYPKGRSNQPSRRSKVLSWPTAS